MIIELKEEVLVRLPTSPTFAKIEVGRKVNFSSSKMTGEVWIYHFSVWHKPTGEILQYAETINGTGKPKWL